MLTRWGVYIIYPFIALPHIRDCILIFVSVGAMATKRYRAAWGKVIPLSMPPEFVTMTSLVTCYSEGYQSVEDNINNLMSPNVTKLGKNFFLVCELLKTLI